MRDIEVAQKFVQELQKLEGSQVIELHQAEVAHEGRAVETIYDELNLVGVEAGCLAEDFSRGLGASEEASFS